MQAEHYLSQLSLGDFERQYIQSIATTTPVVASGQEFVIVHSSSGGGLVASPVNYQHENDRDMAQAPATDFDLIDTHPPYPGPRFRLMTPEGGIPGGSSFRNARILGKIHEHEHSPTKI